MVGVFWGAFAKAQPQRNAANIGELLAWQGRSRNGLECAQRTRARRNFGG
jgi:hypothetical protein